MHDLKANIHFDKVHSEKHFVMYMSGIETGPKQVILCWIMECVKE